MATKTKTAAQIENGNGDKAPQRYEIEVPYTITLHLRGTTPFLFNRMDIEAYDSEEGPAGSKKPRSRTDYEDMVWRDENGELALPIANVRGSITAAGKYYKSPLGGNGGATTTLREGIVCNAELGTFGVKEWDCIDFRKANFGNRQRTPKPTYRPRLEIGWIVAAPLMVTTPEIYGPAKLLEIVSKAGAVMGVGDGRTIGFGRYVIDHHELQEGLPW